MKKPTKSERALLRTIHDFICGMMLVEEKNPESPWVRHWNTGVATAAMEVLDDNSNQGLLAALRVYKRS